MNTIINKTFYRQRKNNTFLMTFMMNANNMSRVQCRFNGDVCVFLSFSFRMLHAYCVSVCDFHLVVRVLEPLIFLFQSRVAGKGYCSTGDTSFRITVQDCIARRYLRGFSSLTLRFS